jgi:hypothetical protein
MSVANCQRRNDPRSRGARSRLGLPIGLPNQFGLRRMAGLVLKYNCDRLSAGRKLTHQHVKV